MKTKTVLIVEDNLQTLGLIQDTLDEARAGYHICASTQDGWDAIRTNPSITNVIVRMNSNAIDGCELTQRIRTFRSAEQLSILMVVGEDQLELAGNALDAGANDVLIDPFEARELRMRMNIRVGGPRHRVDMPHALENGTSEAADAMPANAQAAITYADDGVVYERVSNFVAPTFDPVSMRFTYGVSEEQVAAWKSDESVTKVALDQIMVCPCCSAVPRFGSAAAAAEAPGRRENRWFIIMRALISEQNPSFIRMARSPVRSVGRRDLLPVPISKSFQVGLRVRTAVHEAVSLS